MSFAAVAGAATSALLPKLFGGGSSGGAGSMAQLLAGGLTSQRIPGQTQAGAYTPDGNTVGATYNYIPTGASQIDPQLLQLIMGGAGANQGVLSGDASQMGGLNAQSFAALQNIMQNPGIQQLLTGAQGVSSAANWAAPLANNIGQNAFANSGYLDQTARNLGSGWGDYKASLDANPYTAQAQAGAGAVGQQMTNAGNQVLGAGSNLLDRGTNLSSLYDQTALSRLQNPFDQQALSGAQQAGSMLQQSGQSAYGQGANVAGTASQALPAASAVLNTAFDPQNALYDRTLHETQDQLGTYLARSGLTDSGAGGKIASDALSNFNIDWQNNQLGRQTQGLSAFNSGVGGAGQNIATGQGLQTQGAGSVATGAALPGQTYNAQTAQQLGTLGQYGQGLTTGAGLANSGASLSNSGANLAAGGNTYAANTYSDLLAPQLQALQGYGSAAGQMGNLLGQSTSIGNSGINNLGSGINFAQVGASAPYNASQQIGTDQLGGLSSFLGNASSGSNLGNQNISQMLSYLNSVMTGSNNAANATKGVAGTTQNQNAGASAALSPLIQGGFDWLGSLFGGNGSSTTLGPQITNQATSLLGGMYGY